MTNVESFKQDGVYTQSITAQGPLGTSAKIINRGNYTSQMKEDSVILTTHIDSVDLVMEGALSDKAQKAQDRFAKKRQKLLSEANKDPITTLKWVGDDTLTFKSRDGSTVFLHRVKSP